MGHPRRLYHESNAKKPTLLRGAHADHMVVDIEVIHFKPHAIAWLGHRCSVEVSDLRDHAVSRFV